MLRKYYHFLLSILSGILLIFGYPPYNFSGFIWIALIPLLIFIYDRKTNSRRAFRGGYLTGSVFFAITTSWFLFASMADWVGPERKIIIILILALTWLVYILFASVFTGAAAYLFFRLRSQNWLDIFLFPALWVIFEYLRAWGLTIFALGPGSLWGPHFTLGHLGYAAANSPFLFPAGIAGVYGLSFLIVFINCLIFFLFDKLKKSVLKSALNKDSIIRFGLCFSLIVFLIIGSFYYFPNIGDRKDSGAKKIMPATIIQTNFPSLFSYTSEQEKEFLDVELNLFREVLQEKEWPRIIVFPEHSKFLQKLNHFYPSFLSSETPINQNLALILDSGWHSNEKVGSAVTRLVYFDFQIQKIIGRYDKMLLMPFGDYLPYFSTAILNLTGHQDWIVNMEMTRGYEKGEDLTVVEYDGVKIGGLMCSEIISPYLYKELVAKGAEVLVSVASDAVFQGDPMLRGQLLAIAKTRAKENNRYLIQAANQGDSFIIDNQGKVVAKSKKIGNEVVNAEVKAVTGRTFYNRFGDWILIFAGLVVSAALLAKTGFRFRR